LKEFYAVETLIPPYPGILALREGLVPMITLNL